jgi:pimeloyl-ACP methyl ester carboxylesterase
LELGPARVVANSFGSIVALNAAIRRPEVFATLIAHEPPLLGMLSSGEFGRDDSCWATGVAERR